jgi:hypothetical protein
MARNWGLTWTNFDFESLDVVVVFLRPCARARKRNNFMRKHMMMFVLALDFYFQFQIALSFFSIHCKNDSSIDMILINLIFIFYNFIVIGVDSLNDNM